MKNKTFKRLICFLLAFVVMLSLPLDFTANAVATESWMVYALITYLAGMGITFTVTGGVDAMIQAMEEKVKDYEQANNITDFYEYMRNRNVRLVPNNNQDPDGNPFFDLFFTASAVEAIQAFVNWLTTEGGWNGDVEYESKYIEGLTTDGVILLSDCRPVGLSEQIKVGRLGDLFTPEEIENIGLETDRGIVTFDFVPNSSGKIWTLNVYIDGVLFNDYNLANQVLETDVLTFGIRQSGSNYISDNVLLLRNPTLYDTYYSTTRLALLNVNDYAVNYVYLNVDSKTEIMTPEQLEILFPSVDQGVSIADAISVPMGDPSLIEWGNRIEETFIETGTIPQPQPVVIGDPDYAPAPSPVPTPVPSPEIEDIDDLGLPTLGDAIFNKFPFSLPKDLKRIAVILNAEPVTPFWEVNLYETLGNRVPFAGDTTIRIDLAEYEALGQISRWASVITFVIFLVIITKGVIRW